MAKSKYFFSSFGKFMWLLYCMVYPNFFIFPSLTIFIIQILSRILRQECHVYSSMVLLVVKVLSPNDTFSLFFGLVKRQKYFNWVLFLSFSEEREKEWDMSSHLSASPGIVSLLHRFCQLLSFFITVCCRKILPSRRGLSLWYAKSTECRNN